MTASRAIVDEHCPRCGGEFHCGVNDTTPCACTGFKLDAALLSELRGRWDGCLCLRCLVHLQEQQAHQSQATSARSG